jgi:hypothetical protein
MMNLTQIDEFQLLRKLKPTKLIHYTATSYVQSLMLKRHHLSANTVLQICLPCFDEKQAPAEDTETPLTSSPQRSPYDSLMPASCEEGGAS